MFHCGLKNKKYGQQKNLQDHIKKVEEKTQEIPEEFLTEPQMHIVGPAIEASKFYIDSEQLRQMFANLISASIDSRKIEQTHPSFVEIIKQLSPLDAGVLANFKHTNRVPLVQLRVCKENSAYIIVQNHIMNFSNNQFYKSHASSLSNLQRLGLLDINYSTLSSDDSEYEYVKDHPAFFASTEKQLEIQKIDPAFIKINIQKGLCGITPLCEDFIQICL
jgi:hypothetical protein